MQTQVFQLALQGGKGSAYLRSTSSLEADAGYELNGEYCAWFNKEVACQQLDFNQLPAEPGLRWRDQHAAAGQHRPASSG